VVNRHKSAAHTDTPDGGTGKTYIGGGMHCPSASSFRNVFVNSKTIFRHSVVVVIGNN